MKAWCLDLPRNGWIQFLPRLLPEPVRFQKHLAAELDGGHSDPRSHEFLQRLEAGTANRLAKASERMNIPLAKWCS
jgi:hypothetical protein